ncbi:nucleotidyltransferase family protein [Kiritimatiellota bacterium B12222]|nr:nucleotidyltransferase family protein [Kiritimatiellota bacterium B12222]
MRRSALRNHLLQDLCSPTPASSPTCSLSHRELHTLPPELVRYLPTWFARYPQATGDVIPRIRGVANQARLRQRLLFQEVQTVLDDFITRDISFAVCKGAAVLSLTGLHAGDRILYDVDVLVSKQDMAEVTDVLRRGGWKERMGNAEDRLRLSHHIDWVSPSGSRLNIQWALLGEALDAERVARALERKVPLREGFGLKGHSLSFQDQLFQSIIVGQDSWKGGSIRWVVDGCMLIQSAGDEIRWPGVWEDWVEAGVEKPAWAALSSLRKFQPILLAKPGRISEAVALLQMKHRERLSRYFGLLFLYHRWFSECRKRYPDRVPNFGTWLGAYTGAGPRRNLPRFFVQRLRHRIGI